MRARAHGLTGGAAWLGLAEGASVLHRLAPSADALPHFAAQPVEHALAAAGPWSPLVTYGGAVLAAGYAIWPDLDCAHATAARSLGWPSRLVGWLIDALTDHRGGSHRVVTCTLLAAAVWLLAFVPYVSAAVILLGVAFASAALTAHLRTRRCNSAIGLLSAVLFLRRTGPFARLLISVGLTLGLLYLDPTPTWLAGPVLVGGLAHLFGDMLTRSKFAALAPFIRREIGGWGIIPPTPKGQRVTWQEAAIEILLVATCAAAAWSMVPASVVA